MRERYQFSWIRTLIFCSVDRICLFQKIRMPSVLHNYIYELNREYIKKSIEKAIVTNSQPGTLSPSLFLNIPEFCEGILKNYLLGNFQKLPLPRYAV